MTSQTADDVMVGRPAGGSKDFSFLFSFFFYCPIRFCSWTTDGQLPAASCVSSLFFIGVFFSTLLIGRTDPSPPPLLPSTQSFWYANELSLSLSLSLSLWPLLVVAPFARPFLFSLDSICSRFHYQRGPFNVNDSPLS